MLAVPVCSRTNVVLTSRQPLEVLISGRPEVSNGIRLWADDPAALVAAVREQCPEPTISAHDDRAHPFLG